MFQHDWPLQASKTFRRSHIACLPLWIMWWRNETTMLAFRGLYVRALGETTPRALPRAPGCRGSSDRTGNHLQRFEQPAAPRVG